MESRRATQKAAENNELFGRGPRKVWLSGSTQVFVELAKCRVGAALGHLEEVTPARRYRDLPYELSFLRVAALYAQRDCRD